MLDHSPMFLAMLTYLEVRLWYAMQRGGLVNGFIQKLLTILRAPLSRSSYLQINLNLEVLIIS